ncbi:MAG TPA: hypothetical protein VHV74_02930 [Pseudonocardiaceae bacterium]|nr:hypothetical protein [Pseudonocardiaceae bacterium]
MSTSQWTRRLAVTGCAAGVGLAVLGTGVASAQGSTSDPTQPAPITISSAQVQQLCDVRVPRLKAEVSKLITRIDGGPAVTGSTAWLKQKAQQAQANGHTARAGILNGRAERRTGVRTILNKVQTKLNDFTTAHCGGGR